MIRDLQDRQAGGATAACPPATPTPAKTLEDLLAGARAVRPPRGTCCGHCFGDGRDAAIAAIEGDLLAR
jgi:hypothetical protein